VRTDIEYVRSLEARLVELRTAADQADAEYRAEIARLRLTEEEREAIDAAQLLAGLEAAATYNENNEREKESWNDCKSTLRLLLERTR
jgi:hypothetical protein